jgi:hypothetical protein
VKDELESFLNELQNSFNSTEILRLLKLCVELRLMTEKFDLLDTPEEEIWAHLEPRIEALREIKGKLTEFIFI